MSGDESEFHRQMAAARQCMDQYREALAALAGPDSMSEDMKREVERARAPMEKYKTGYRKLAGS